MATFAYEALNAAGKPQKGTIEATSSEEAVQRIKAQGFFPTSVKETKGKKTGIPGAADAGKKPKKKKKSAGLSFGGVGQKQLTLFTRQLSTLQDAGLPLLRSLQILESQHFILGPEVAGPGIVPRQRDPPRPASQCRQATARPPHLRLGSRTQPASPRTERAARLHLRALPGA